MTEEAGALIPLLPVATVESAEGEPPNRRRDRSPRSTLLAAQTFAQVTHQNMRPKQVAQIGEIDAARLATRLTTCTVGRQVSRFGERPVDRLACPSHGHFTGATRSPDTFAMPGLVLN